MYFLGKAINSTYAMEKGLVSSISWPNMFKSDLFECAYKLSQQSTQVIFS